MQRERQVVERSWDLMRSDDFAAVATVLTDRSVLERPGTDERFHGREPLG